MKQIGKILARFCVGALSASLIPYQIRKDMESGGFEIRSVLWAVKKTPGEERDRYEFELFPLIGGGKTHSAESEAAVEEIAGESEAEAAEETSE